MANEFIIKNGFHSKGDSQITGSLSITGIADVSASIAAAGGSTPTLNEVITAGASATGDVSITGSLTISGSANVFKFDQTALIIGQEAGNSLTVNSVDNTFLGRRAGFQTSAGDQNVFVGDQAGQIGDHAQDVAVGHLAGANSTSAEKHNTQIGAEAGRNNWQGSGNTFIGYRAGFNGYHNEGCIIIGSGSVGQSVVAGGGLTQQLRIGNGSIHVISGSLETGDVIFYNTASAPNFSGSFQGDGTNLNLADNTTIPAASTPTLAQVVTAGSSATGDVSITGSLTISGSFHAFRLNSQNVVLGQDAGFSTTINGPRNVFVGYQAAYTNTIGDDNVCIGRAAGYALGTNASDANIFIGSLAGAGDTAPTARMSDANNNIGIGYEALLYLTSGDSNIGIGYRTMRLISSGQDNLALGNGALYNTNSGDKNIGIGQNAGSNQTTGDGNITIGSGSNGIAGESNQLRIGHTDVIAISGSLATGDVIFYNTASAPNFSGSFQGDGSNLTGTGTVVTGNGGGSGDTLSTINIGGTTFTVATGTGNGTVDTSGTPVDNDYAKFTDGNTIEGRSVSEVKTDLSLNNVENTAISTFAGTSNITTVGTIGTGTWQGTAIASAYLDSDTAHLTGTQTFSGAKTFSSGITISGNNYINFAGAAGGGGEGIKFLDTSDGNREVLHFPGNDLVVLSNRSQNGIVEIRSNNNTSGASGETLSARFTATGSFVSRSLEIDGSGSGLFKVEGSVGTLFSVDDGLDDVIFAANNISGTPVISANADNTVKLGKLGGFGIVISGSTPAPNDSQAKIIVTGSMHTSGSLGVGMAASSTVGRIDANNDVVAFSTSDERLKDNIVPIEDALNKVSQVQGIEFDWIPKEGVHGNEGRDVGVIAQEIEKVLPEVVTTRDNGYKAVKYEKIIPLLVEAIKELQEEIKELKKDK